MHSSWKKQEEKIAVHPYVWWESCWAAAIATIILSFLPSCVCVCLLCPWRRRNMSSRAVEEGTSYPCLAADLHCLQNKRLYRAPALVFFNSLCYFFIHFIGCYSYLLQIIRCLTSLCSSAWVCTFLRLKGKENGKGAWCCHKWCCVGAKLKVKRCVISFLVGPQIN